MARACRPGLLAALAGALLGALCAAGCGAELDVGSDVLWTARFEGGGFDEYTSVPGGAANAYPAPSAIEASAERPHGGAFAAKLTIDAGPDGQQQNTGLVRSGGLPTEGYYSAWYYLPRSVTVGGFWVIFKLRVRAVADDPTTEAELYDLDLSSLPSGEMTLHLYDHRTGGDVPLGVPEPIVPVGVWFQVEAYYRNAPDQTGRVTFWLDGRQIVDLADQPMGPTPWVGWDVVSVGVDLMPSLVTLYIDDCAVSRARVGPRGIIAR